MEFMEVAKFIQKMILVTHGVNKLLLLCEDLIV